MAGCHQTRLCLSWADDGSQTRLSWVCYGQRVRRRASCGGCACFKNASSRSVRKRCISRHMARGHARLPHAMRCNIPRMATPGSAHRGPTHHAACANALLAALNGLRLLAPMDCSGTSQTRSTPLWPRVVVHSRSTSGGSTREGRDRVWCHL